MLPKIRANQDASSVMSVPSRQAVDEPARHKAMSAR